MRVVIYIDAGMAGKLYSAGPSLSMHAMDQSH